jgi:hypothetical protein
MVVKDMYTMYALTLRTVTTSPIQPMTQGLRQAEFGFAIVCTCLPRTYRADDAPLRVTRPPTLAGLTTPGLARFPMPPWRRNPTDFAASTVPRRN